MPKVRNIKRKGRPLLIGAAAAAGLCLFCTWQNNDIVTTRIDYRSERLPAAFDGYTVVHISDLHNKRFGKGQGRLLEQIEKAGPDIIFVTGDLIDARHTDLDAAMELISGAAKLAPVYYVSGNHEARSGVYPELKERLTLSGATVLDNDAVKIGENGAYFNVIGLSDPAFFPPRSGKKTMQETLGSLHTDSDALFNILLSHRPELFELYAGSGVDLVFSGHAHGGQVRLPFLGGLVAPGQGFFPEYTSGTYEKGGTTMVLSRGLGNSIIPVRVFNRPEIVVVTLYSRV